MQKCPLCAGIIIGHNVKYDLYPKADYVYKMYMSTS